MIGFYRYAFQEIGFLGHAPCLLKERHLSPSKDKSWRHMTIVEYYWKRNNNQRPTMHIGQTVEY